MLDEGLPNDAHFMISDDAFNADEAPEQKTRAGCKKRAKKFSVHSALPQVLPHHLCLIMPQFWACARYTFRFRKYLVCAGTSGL